MMRQVAGACMEYEKGCLVAKLRGARERKRKETGKKVGGLKAQAELWPEVVAEARRLRRAKGKASCLPRNQRQAERGGLLQRSRANPSIPKASAQ